jgi:hypothetical protein
MGQSLSRKQQEKFKNHNKIIGFLEEEYSIESYFTKLTIISAKEKWRPAEAIQIEEKPEEEIAVKGDELALPFLRSGTVYSVKAEKEITTAVHEEIELLFNNPLGTTNKILLVGEPGIGKSTLVKYMCYQWSIGKLWKYRFDHLWLIELKELTAWLNDCGADGRLIETRHGKVVLREFSSIADKYSNFIYFTEKKKLNGIKPNFTKADVLKRITSSKELFILDGFDEITVIIGQAHVDPFKEAREFIDSFDNIIVTSRPNSVYEQKLAAKDIFDKIIVNIGFTKEGRFEYIKRYFRTVVSKQTSEVDLPLDEKTTETINNMVIFIEENEMIQDLCRVPLNIEILCFLWQDDYSRMKLQDDFSLTMLYHLMECRLLEWYKYKNENKKEFSADMKQFLKESAYTGLVRNQVRGVNREIVMELLNQKFGDSEHLKEQFMKEICNSGFLHPVHPSWQIKIQDYYFNHKTFQEYFAAQYVIDGLTSQDKIHYSGIESLVLGNCYRSYYLQLFKFISGIFSVYFQERPTTALIQALEQFFSLILQGTMKINELNGAVSEENAKKQMILLMHLLHQISPSICKEFSCRSKTILLCFDHVNNCILSNPLLCTSMIRETGYSSILSIDFLLNIINQGQNVSEIVSSVQLLKTIKFRGSAIYPRVLHILECLITDPNTVSVVFQETLTTARKIAYNNKKIEAAVLARFEGNRLIYHFSIPMISYLSETLNPIPFFNSLFSIFNCYYTLPVALILRNKYDLVPSLFWLGGIEYSYVTDTLQELIDDFQMRATEERRDDLKIYISFKNFYTHGDTIRMFWNEWDRNGMFYQNLFYYLCVVPDEKKKMLDMLFKLYLRRYKKHPIKDKYIINLMGLLGNKEALNLLISYLHDKNQFKDSPHCIATVCNALLELFQRNQDLVTKYSLRTVINTLLVDLDSAEKFRLLYRLSYFAFSESTMKYVLEIFVERIVLIGANSPLDTETINLDYWSFLKYCQDMCRLSVNHTEKALANRFIRQFNLRILAQLREAKARVTIPGSVKMLNGIIHNDEGVVFPGLESSIIDLLLTKSKPAAVDYLNFVKVLFHMKIYFLDNLPTVLFNVSAVVENCLSIDIARENTYPITWLPMIFKIRSFEDILNGFRNRSVSETTISKENEFTELNVTMEIDLILVLISQEDLSFSDSEYLLIEAFNELTALQGTPWDDRKLVLHRLVLAVFENRFTSLKLLFESYWSSFAFECFLEYPYWLYNFYLDNEMYFDEEMLQYAAICLNSHLELGEYTAIACYATAKLINNLSLEVNESGLIKQLSMFVHELDEQDNKEISTSKIINLILYNVEDNIHRNKKPNSAVLSRIIDVFLYSQSISVRRFACMILAEFCSSDEKQNSCYWRAITLLFYQLSEDCFLLFDQTKEWMIYFMTTLQQSHDNIVYLNCCPFSRMIFEDISSNIRQNDDSGFEISKFSRFYFLVFAITLPELFSPALLKLLSGDSTSFEIIVFCLLGNQRILESVDGDNYFYDKYVLNFRNLELFRNVINQTNIIITLQHLRDNTNLFMNSMVTLLCELKKDFPTQFNKVYSEKPDLFWGAYFPFDVTITQLGYLFDKFPDEKRYVVRWIVHREASIGSAETKDLEVLEYLFSQVPINDILWYYRNYIQALSFPVRKRYERGLLCPHKIIERLLMNRIMNQLIDDLSNSDNIIQQQAINLIYYTDYDDDKVIPNTIQESKLLLDFERIERIEELYKTMENQIYHNPAMERKRFELIRKFVQAKKNVIFDKENVFRIEFLLPLSNFSYSFDPIYPSVERPSFDVFLSHNWGTDEENRDNHQRVSRINSMLKDKGIKTWFDEEQIEGNIRDTMATAIVHSKLILIFITKRYNDKIERKDISDNCYYEFNFATKEKSNHIDAVVMEKKMRNTCDWCIRLRAELGNLLFTDLSEDLDIESKCGALANKIISTVAMY